MIQHISKKPSIQEELTEEIGKELRKMIPDCLGTIVVVKGFHTCIARYKEGWMITSSLSGASKHNPFIKEEFFNLIHKDDKEIF
jgi:GTP cyclohydrolase I